MIKVLDSINYIFIIVIYIYIYIYIYSGRHTK